MSANDPSAPEPAAAETPSTRRASRATGEVARPRKGRTSAARRTTTRASEPRSARPSASDGERLLIQAVSEIEALRAREMKLIQMVADRDKHIATLEAQLAHGGGRAASSEAERQLRQALAKRGRGKGRPPREIQRVMEELQSAGELARPARGGATRRTRTRKSGS